MAKASDIESIVNRFFKSRADGGQESIEDIIRETPKVEDSIDLRTKVAESISTKIKTGEGLSGAEDDFDFENITEVDGYEIIDMVGRGGMGVVYEAYQVATGQRVAIKFLNNRKGPITPSMRHRFEREVDLTARLQHPGAPAILDSGIRDGRYYYVMQFVDGRQLDDAIRNMRLEHRLKLLIEICETVAYAHERGVLHRDLKPANILVDQYDKPHVLDFGLAKGLDRVTNTQNDRTISMPGQLLGTLEYMSPEQSRGDLTSVGYQSDIYSLGAIGYEIVTGKVPIEYKEPLIEFLKRLETVEPTRPSQTIPEQPVRNGWQRLCDRDLDAVLLKALAKEPSMRYKNADAFGTDIRRWLDGYSVVARTPTNAERLKRWSRRNPVIAKLLSLTAILFVLLVAVSWFLTFRERLHRRSIEESAYHSDMIATQTALSFGDNKRAAFLLNKYNPVNIGRELRCFEWYYLKRKLYDSEIDPIACYDSSTLAFLPVRELLVVATGHQVRIFDTKNRNPTLVEEFTSAQQCEISKVIASADGNLITIVGRQPDEDVPMPTIQIWQLDPRHKATLWKSWEEFGRIKSVALNPPGDLLVFADRTGQVFQVDLLQDHRKAERLAQKHVGLVSDMVISSDGQLLLTAGEDQKIRIYNFSTGKTEPSLEGHVAPIQNISLSSDGRILVSVDKRSVVRVWDFAERKPTRRNSTLEHPGAISAEFSPDANVVVTAGEDKSIRVWNREQVTYINSSPTIINGHSRPVSSIVFFGNRKIAASEYAVRDELEAISEVSVWDIERAYERSAITLHDDYVRSIEFSADDKELYTGGHDGTLRMSSLTPLNLESTYHFNHDSKLAKNDPGLKHRRIRALAVSADDEMLFIGGTNKCISSVSTADFTRLLWTTVNVESTVRRIVASKNSQLIASAHENGFVYVWNAKNGSKLATIDASEHGRCTAIAFLDEYGTKIATGHQKDGLVRIWDSNQGRFLFSLPNVHSGEIRCLAVSSDFSSLAAAYRANVAANGTACIWDLKNKTLTHQLANHRGDVEVLAFAPNGRTLATAGTDNSIRLWNTRSGKLSLVLTGHQRPICALNFSNNGKTLASGDFDGVVRLWRSD